MQERNDARLQPNVLFLTTHKASRRSLLGLNAVNFFLAEVVGVIMLWLNIWVTNQSYPAPMIPIALSGPVSKRSKKFCPKIYGHDNLHLNTLTILGSAPSRQRSLYHVSRVDL